MKRLMAVIGVWFIVMIVAFIWLQTRKPRVTLLRSSVPAAGAVVEYYGTGALQEPLMLSVDSQGAIRLPSSDRGRLVVWNCVEGLGHAGTQTLAIPSMGSVAIDYYPDRKVSMIRRPFPLGSETWTQIPSNPDDSAANAGDPSK